MKTQNAERTQNGRDPKSGQFQLGHIGTGGRPKGSRNKLGEQFIADAYERWKISGPAALKTMAEEDPSGFCKLIGNILPKEINSDLNINVEMFAGCETFAQAFRIARQYLSGDTIDVKPNKRLAIAND